MKRLLLFFTFLLLLNGCAAVPSIPELRITKGEKVGLFIDISSVLIHTHESAHLFQDIEKTYEIDPDLYGYAKDKVTTALRRDGGYEVVYLNDLGFSRIELTALVAIKDRAWIVPPSRASVFAKLRDELGLKAVVVIKEQKTAADAECYGPYGCRTFYTKGQGLFTKGSILGDFYTAVAAYHTDIFVLDPPVNLALGRRSIELRRWNTTRMKNVPKSQDFKNISRATWDYTVMTIKSSINRLADVTTKMLSGQAIEIPKPRKF